MLYNDESKVYEDIYKKLLSDKLDLNLGYLYENAVAQMIKAAKRELYYHTWRKQESTHSYEVDFIVTSHAKIVPLEVKSGSTKYHNSIDAFSAKYSRNIYQSIVISSNDVKNEQMLLFKPIYFLPFILEEK